MASFYYSRLRIISPPLNFPLTFFFGTVDGSSSSYKTFSTLLYLHTIIYIHCVAENRDYWRNALYNHDYR